MLKVSRHHRGELAWSFSLFLLKPKQNKHLPRNSIYTFLWIDVFFYFRNHVSMPADFLRPLGSKAHLQAKWVKVTQSCLTFLSPHRLYKSMEFSRPECWSGQPFPSPGDLPSPARMNPGLPHCRQILYQLNLKGSPRILEQVAYSFASRSSNPGIKPGSPALQVDSLPTELSGNSPSKFFT